jgi:hypothetical protein
MSPEAEQFTPPTEVSEAEVEQEARQAEQGGELGRQHGEDAESTERMIERLEGLAASDIRAFEAAGAPAAERAGLPMSEADRAAFEALNTQARGLLEKFKTLIRRKLTLFEKTPAPKAEKQKPEATHGKGGVSRREFLRSAAAAAGLLATRPLEAWAESLRAACDPGGEDKLLAKACEAKLGALERARLVEALRSSITFKKIADHITLPDKEKLVGLYPGGGEHIAPLEMARELFKKKSGLNEVELRYTEIDPNRVDNIIHHLGNLPKLDAGYAFNKEEVTRQPGVGKDGKGEVITIPLTADGRPITIKYLLNYSGEEYFDEQTYAESDFFIEHDSGSDMDEGLAVAELAVLKAQQTGHRQPILMEDYRQAYNPNEKKHVRKIDLELFGTVTPVPGIYGHRDEEVVDGQRRPDGKHPWTKVEIGQSYTTGAAILEMHPALASASSEDVAAIFDSSILSHTYSNEKDNAVRLGNMVGRGEEPSKVLEDINPKIAEGFRVRQLMALVNSCKNMVFEDYVQSFAQTDDAFMRAAEFSASLQQTLPRTAHREQALLLFDEIMAVQKEALHFRLEQSRLREEIKKYTSEHGITIQTPWEELRKDATYMELSRRSSDLGEQWVKRVYDPYKERIPQVLEKLKAEADAIFDSLSPDLPKAKKTSKPRAKGL